MHQQFGVNDFNQLINIIEMTGMKDMSNYIISLYKDTVWKNRRTSSVMNDVTSCDDSRVTLHTSHDDITGKIMYVT